MICYQDKTFCTESTCKKFGDMDEDCQRSLTLAVEHMADFWWNRGRKAEDCSPAMVMTFIERQNCYEKGEQ